MNLESLYNSIGANYKDAARRLMSEAYLLRFVKMFPEDPSFSALQTAMEQGNIDEAFRAAHTLKGVCANLGFTGLGDTASQLTELLRSGKLEGTAPLLKQLSEDYMKLVEGIGQLD